MNLLKNEKTRLSFYLLLLIMAAFTIAACSSNESSPTKETTTVFKATNVFEPSPAPDFALTDFTGHDVKLSGLQGKPVVLTFIYTNCPDVCPIITAKLNQSLQLLGSDSSKVEIVAITVDPERDTPARAREYSDQQGIGERWHFITGDEEHLKPVWEAYGVYQQREKVLSELNGTPHPDDGYTVAHSAPVYVIDKTGAMRLAFGGFEMTPDDLVHDLKLLY